VDYLLPEATSVEIDRLCMALKRRVSVAMGTAADLEERNGLLISALYEMSRSVLPLLGSPDRSGEYLAAQAAVLELISFLTIPLVRGAVPERRAVAVLAELAEGCPDPELKRKLTVYAQELLAKSGEPRVLDAPHRTWRPFRWLLISAAALLLAGFLCKPAPKSPRAPSAGQKGAEAQHRQEEPPATAEEGEPEPASAYPAPSRVHQEERPAGNSLSVLQPPAAASPQGDQWTRVRVVNSQVLVPVTLKNAGETITVELVLDTGATHTVLHDSLAPRLQIDPRQLKVAVSEVADGRVIRSRQARIEAITVGPFALAPAEVEFIAYAGSDELRKGLLGMDFLGKHRYQLDVEREVIRWF